MKYFRYSMLLFVLLLTLFSCATSIPLTITKPAEVNMSAYKKLVVMDFTYARTSWYSEASMINRYASGRLIESLASTNYFQIISSKDISTWIVNAKSISDWNSQSFVQLCQSVGAQGLIAPELVSLERIQNYRVVQEQVKDKMTGAVTYVDVRYVNIVDSAVISYRVVDASNGMVYATKTFNESITQDGKVGTAFMDLSTTGKEMIDKVISAITRQLAPYTETQYRVLMNDSMKDPEIKTAFKMVEDRQYEAAQKKFAAIYAKTKNPAAGVNAAIMLEVLGRIDEAIAFIEKVVAETGNPTARNEEARMRAVKAEQDKLHSQL